MCPIVMSNKTPTNNNTVYSDDHGFKDFDLSEIIGLDGYLQYHSLQHMDDPVVSAFSGDDTYFLTKWISDVEDLTHDDNVRFRCAYRSLLGSAKITCRMHSVRNWTTMKEVLIRETIGVASNKNALLSDDHHKPGSFHRR